MVRLLGLEDPPQPEDNPVGARHTGKGRERPASWGDGWQTMGSPLGSSSMRGGHELGRARLLPSRVNVERTAARQEPRPTGGRFMERGLSENPDGLLGRDVHRRPSAVWNCSVRAYGLTSRNT